MPVTVMEIRSAPSSVTLTVGAGEDGLSQLLVLLVLVLVWCC
jgi:hypothetical protein